MDIVNWVVELLNSQTGILITGWIIGFVYLFLRKKAPKLLDFKDRYSGILLHAVSLAEKHFKGKGKGKEKLEFAFNISRKFIEYNDKGGKVMKKPEEGLLKQALTLIHNEVKKDEK